MKKNGFTLLEVIFALGIWSLLILLTVPIQFSILDRQEEEQFFRTFESDILYMQSMSYASPDYIRLVMDAENNSYEIKGLPNKNAIKRTFPSDWEIKIQTLQKIISFNKLGTIKHPGTMKIMTTSATYKIIFPLGKGRCYIEKQ